jgi:hypothetical protein
MNDVNGDGVIDALDDINQDGVIDSVDKQLYVLVEAGLNIEDFMNELEAQNNGEVNE